MSTDRFEATFVLGILRPEAWRRLTEHPVDDGDVAHYWLPGFDATARVTAEAPEERLEAVKVDQPCAGTIIVVTLESASEGTRITVVQSGFADMATVLGDLLAVGWRHIVADLETYLATGAHAGRHLRPWGDLGAETATRHGGIAIGEVRPDSLADRVGLHSGDLLVALAGAPVANQDDLTTILRVLATTPGPVTAEWIRDGSVCSATA